MVMPSPALMLQLVHTLSYPMRWPMLTLSSLLFASGLWVVETQSGHLYKFACTELTGPTHLMCHQMHQATVMLLADPLGAAEQTEVLQGLCNSKAPHVLRAFSIVVVAAVAVYIARCVEVVMKRRYCEQRGCSVVGPEERAPHVSVLLLLAYGSFVVAVGMAALSSKVICPSSSGLDVCPMAQLGP